MAVALVSAVFVAVAMASLDLAERLFAAAVDCCICHGNGCLGGYRDCQGIIWEDDSSDDGSDDDNDKTSG
eukprot:13312982-Ditylum_brightwellii.AAC.1